MSSFICIDAGSRRVDIFIDKEGDCPVEVTIEKE